MSRALAIAFCLSAAATGLAGCLTPSAKVKPSPAVLEARHSAASKAETCQATPLAEVSPTSTDFPYDDSVLDRAGKQRLARVAQWLACHPQTRVVILPSADKHGDAAHQKDLAARRAQAAIAELRAAGATAAVIQTLEPGAADPVTGPHVVIEAAGRGW